MKLYLASFIEPHNFGNGRVIGIANGNKPEHIRCDVVFEPLIPTSEIMELYNNMRVNDPLNASTSFVDAFNDQLEKFSQKVETKAKEEGKNPMDILPFKDGDTLASWERKAFTNYRSLVAPILERLGYEVELN